MRSPRGSYRAYRQQTGPPAWLVFVLAVALVFGLYYLWIGLRNFLETGGLGIQEATSRAEIIASATGMREATRLAASGGLNTREPNFATPTPRPECVDFVVIVPVAIVRNAPTTNAEVLAQLPEGEIVCMLSKEGEWYIIDQNPRTRRIDTGYMRDDLIEALNPTPTPLPTVTALPTLTPSITPLVSATFTPSPTPPASSTPEGTDQPERPTLTPRPTEAIPPTPTRFMQGA